jgi:hypothetical protein
LFRLAWIGLLGALVGTTLYAVSAPGWYFELSLAVVAAWILVGAGWVVSVGARALRRRSLFVLEAADFVTPALVPLVWALVHFDVALHARYRLSRGAMDAAAKTVVAHPQRATTIHRIGLWPTDRVERIPGGMRFTVSEAGFLDAGGFAYGPVGEPANVGGEDVYTHLDGLWYLWDESW